MADMDTDAERRLKGFRDDLAQIGELPGRFGFGIVSSMPEVRLKHELDWRFLDPFVNRQEEDITSLKPPPHSFDPFDEGRQCILWWGNSDNAQAFKEWLGRLGNFLDEHEDLLPGERTEQNLERRGNIVEATSPVEEVYHRTLSVLWSLAVREPSLSGFLLQWDIVDTKQVPLPSAPPALKRQGAPPKFIMQEPKSSATEFGSTIIDYLLERLPGPPRLTMDVEAKTVTLDGKTIPMDEESFLIVKVLIEGGGHRQLASQITEKEPLLKGGRRFGRRVDDLQERYKEIGAVIGRSKESPYGYWIEEDYLK